MPYLPNIPQPTDQLSQSQADILGNFQALDPIVNGINNFIKLPEQGVGPATAVNQMALYTKDVGGVTAMFIRPENTLAGGAEVDFTTAVKAADGWTRLPSGILLKWGTATITAGSNPLLVAYGAPNFNHLYSVVVNTITVPVAGHFYFSQITQNGVLTFRAWVIELSGAGANLAADDVDVNWYAVGD